MQVQRLPTYHCAGSGIRTRMPLGTDAFEASAYAIPPPRPAHRSASSNRMLAASADRSVRSITVVGIDHIFVTTTDRPYPPCTGSTTV